MAKNDPVELSSRLTLKELGCDPKRVLKQTEKKIKLAHVYGTASRVGVQLDPNRGGQTYTYFIGMFEGVNLETGEMIQSAKLFLPPGASETLEHMVNQVQDRRPHASVDFAFEIMSAKSNKTDCGYAYETRTILQPQQADMLADVRQTVMEHAEAEKKNAAKKSA